MNDTVIYETCEWRLVRRQWKPSAGLPGPGTRTLTHLTHQVRGTDFLWEDSPGLPLDALIAAVLALAPEY